MKTKDPIKLLQEIEAWLCFNVTPDAKNTSDLRKDIKYCLSHASQQQVTKEKVIELWDKYSEMSWIWEWVEDYGAINRDNFIKAIDELTSLKS